MPLVIRRLSVTRRLAGLPLARIGAARFFGADLLLLVRVAAAWLLGTVLGLRLLRPGCGVGALWLWLLPLGSLR